MSETAEQGAPSPRAPAWHGLLFGAAWGFAIFALSLPIAGHIEPWDGLPGYYPCALLLGGLVAAFFRRTRPLPLWCGLVVGQQIYVFFVSSSGAGNLWPIGIAFGAVSSLIAPVGWCIGALFVRRA